MCKNNSENTNMRKHKMRLTSMETPGAKPQCAKHEKTIKQYEKRRKARVGQNNNARMQTKQINVLWTCTEFGKTSCCFV